MPRIHVEGIRLVPTMYRVNGDSENANKAQWHCSRKNRHRITLAPACASCKLRGRSVVHLPLFATYGICISLSLVYTGVSCKDGGWLTRAGAFCASLWGPVDQINCLVRLALSRRGRPFYLSSLPLYLFWLLCSGIDIIMTIKKLWRDLSYI